MSVSPFFSTPRPEPLGSPSDLSVRGGGGFKCTPQTPDGLTEDAAEGLERARVRGGCLAPSHAARYRPVSGWTIPQNGGQWRSFLLYTSASRSTTAVGGQPTAIVGPRTGGSGTPTAFWGPIHGHLRVVSWYCFTVPLRCVTALHIQRPTRAHSIPKTASLHTIHKVSNRFGKGSCS